MDDYLSLKGPLELIGGDLMIRIPLSKGGHELASVAKGISHKFGLRGQQGRQIHHYTKCGE
jgi:hypothetical protein